MGSVAQLNPELELGRFFDYIYGEETGFAYSPTKDPVSEDFQQYFFHWPTERAELIDHVLRCSPLREVYYGPALFEMASAEKSDYRGTRFVWAEFDGTIPETSLLDLVPEPSLRLRSSTENHQHWYWKLTDFETNPDVVETLSQRLAYHLGADLSCWNSNRVLRPPGTIHHESTNTVTVISWTEDIVSKEAFLALPELPKKLLQVEDIRYVPPVLDVIMKYPWDRDQSAFFQEKSIEKGHRSSALTKLGHICMELGMTNAEALSILLNADSRWGKFAQRRDQKHRLLGIINFCRNKHPVGQAKDEKLETPTGYQIYTYEQFMELDHRIEWVVPGLLHKKGMLLVSGPPSVGKSQLSIRFAEKVARGEKFLKWTPERPFKTLFVSMEMSDVELRWFFDQMQIKTTNSNFLIHPIGQSLKLNNRKTQIELDKVMDQFQPDGVIFDSLGKGIGEDINSEKIIFDTFDFIDKMREYYEVFTWFVHHPRKGQIGNKKPDKLDDLFGSTYIGAALTTAIGLWEKGPHIEVSCLKLRMAEKFKPFNIQRIPGLDFKIVEGLTVSTTKPIFSGLNDLGDSI